VLSFYLSTPGNVAFGLLWANTFRWLAMVAVCAWWLPQKPVKIADTPILSQRSYFIVS
jgi:hypothetical protein